MVWHLFSNTWRNGIAMPEFLEFIILLYRKTCIGIVLKCFGIYSWHVLTCPGLVLRICLTHPRWRSSILFRNSISWEYHPIIFLMVFPYDFVWLAFLHRPVLTFFWAPFPRGFGGVLWRHVGWGPNPALQLGGFRSSSLDGFGGHRFACFFGDSTYSFHGATAKWCYMQFVFECVYTCICMYIYLYLYVYMHWCVCVC